MIQQYTVAFSKVVEFTAALGVKNISELPGCWTHELDQHWHIAVNGHTQGVKAQPTRDDMEVEIDPFCCGVWWNGWYAGTISPVDGVIAAGSAANEDTFIAAVQAAITKAQAQAAQPSLL